jgi:hypothetical protein
MLDHSIILIDNEQRLRALMEKSMFGSANFDQPTLMMLCYALTPIVILLIMGLICKLKGDRCLTGGD